MAEQQRNLAIFMRPMSQKQFRDDLAESKSARSERPLFMARADRAISASVEPLADNVAFHPRLLGGRSRYVVSPAAS